MNHTIHIPQKETFQKLQTDKQIWIQTPNRQQTGITTVKHADQTQKAILKQIIPIKRNDRTSWNNHPTLMDKKTGTAFNTVQEWNKHYTDKYKVQNREETRYLNHLSIF